MTPEFFDGPISREYREILESESRFETAPAKKSGTEGTKCKTDPAVCPKPGTEGTKCKTDATVCPRKFGTEGTRCKSDAHNCPKKHAIAPSVPGWSLPPAPPS
jgi:hypothetical protein